MIVSPTLAEIGEYVIPVVHVALLPPTKCSMLVDVDELDMAIDMDDDELDMAIDGDELGMDMDIDDELDMGDDELGICMGEVYMELAMVGMAMEEEEGAVELDMTMEVEEEGAW